MTLAEFLLARIGEAQAQLPPLPTVEHRERLAGDTAQPWEPTLLWYEDALRAELASKRQLVTELGRTLAEWPTYGEVPWDSCHDDCEYAAAEWMLQQMASPYAAHSDYDPDWRI